MAGKTKQELRSQALLARKVIPRQQRLADEQSVTKKLLNEIAKYKIKKTTDFIAIYRSVGSELSTTELAVALTSSGYQLACPLVLNDGLMEFVQYNIDASNSDSVSNNDSVSSSGRFIQPDQIAIMVVPLVAFDRHCNRLGMGGGYYDRYLTRLPSHIPTFGIAFDQQLQKNLAHQPHDIALSAIITASKVYKAPGRHNND